MARSAQISLALVVALCLAMMHSVPAGRAAEAIVPVPSTNAGATTLANAMVARANTLASARFVTVPPSGTPNGVASTLSFFPSQGSDFGIMTSGDVRIADDPNSAGNAGAANGGVDIPGRGSTAADVTVLELVLNPAANDNCLRLDFAFYSEEFSEFVGTQFNDTFIAELNTSTWTANTAIQAPNNFAFDDRKKEVSINSTGATSMNELNAGGTTYDGATVLLEAATPVGSGQQKLYLSILDQGDQRLDSAVFIDNIRFEQVGDAAEDCQPGAQRKQPPLIFVPGIGGSRLVNDSGEQWPNVQSLYESDDDAFLLNLRLASDGASPFDPSPNDPNDPNDQIYRSMRVDDIPRSGTVKLKWYHSLFAGSSEKPYDAHGTMLQTLKDAGYTENTNFFIYAYDWRKDIRDEAKGLLTLIDKVYKENGETRVDIMAHSMGGLLTRVVLSQEESKGKVRRVLTLGTPVLGAAKALGVLQYRDPCFIANEPLGCLSNPQNVQQAVSNMTGVYQLLPSERYHAAIRSPLEIDRDTNDDAKPEGPQSYQQWTEVLRGDAGRNRELVAKSEAFHREYDTVVPIDPQVEVFRIIGDQVNTPMYVREWRTCSVLGRWFCQVYQRAEWDARGGDGTVPLHSADLYNPAVSFDLRAGGRNFYAHGVEHGSLVNNADVLRFAIALFRSGHKSATLAAAPQSTEPIGEAPLSFSGLEMEVLGPLETRLIGNTGEVVGWFGEGGERTIIDAAPGVSYTIFGDVQLYFLRDATTYQSLLRGFDGKPARLRLSRYEDGVVTGKAVFELNEQAGTQVALTLSQSSVLSDVRLRVDDDSNGTVDRVVAPRFVVEGATAADTTAPSTSVEVTSRDDGTASVRLNAVDTGGVGVDATYYAITGQSGAPQRYTGPFDMRFGQVLEFLSVDRAGNTEELRRMQIGTMIHQIYLPLTSHTP
jgi:pimeloyl-ACP methyl ester carboxylesterase